MDKVSVSGSHGFIAEHLCGHYSEVQRIDRDWLVEPEVLYERLQDFQPDIIYHTSAYGNMSSQTDEHEIVATNLIKTHILLTAISHLEHKPKLVFTSTSSVYGDKTKPMKETDSTDTNSFYGCTKLGAEELCRAYAYKYNIPTVVTRLFSVYGPGEADFRFIPTVINKLKDGGVLTLEPNVYHDWIYVEDVVQILDLLAHTQTGLYEIVNVGSGIQTKNINIVKLLSEIAKGELEVNEVKGLRDYKGLSWKADVTKLYKYIGGYKFTELHDGLTKTYEYYRDTK